MKSIKAASVNEDIGIDHTEIIKSLPIAYMAYEAVPPYRIIDENVAHERVAVTKRDEIVGRPFLEAFPDTSDVFKRTGRSAPIESIKKIVRTGKPDSLGEFNWDVPAKDGTFITKYWRSTQYPIFDSAGKHVVAVYQLTEDITEQKIAEKELALTTYQLDQALAEGMVGTWVWDMKDAKVYAGPNLADMFGVGVEEAKRGLELDEFVGGIHPDDRNRVTKLIERTVQDRSIFESEYRTVDKNGQVRWLIARGRVEVDGAGELDRFPGIVIDITQRKQAEDDLKENESRLRFMADSMPQLVWITRPDGFHEYYNKQWYDYTGTAPGTTDGERWNAIFHPDDQARAWKAWKKSLRTGEPYEIQYRLYHAPHKTYRWVIGRALPLRDGNGDIIKWYGTCTDIDEQRRTSDRQSFIGDVSKELVNGFNTTKMLSKVAKLSVPIFADWCMVDIYSDTDGFEQMAIAHADMAKIGIVQEYRRRNPLTLDSDLAIPRVMKSGKAEFYQSMSDELLKKYINDPATLRFMKKLGLRSMMIIPVKQGRKTIGGLTFVSSDSGRHFTEDDFQAAQELGVRVSLSITNAHLYSESIDDLKRRTELERQLRDEKQTLESRVRERTTQLQLTNQGLRDEIIKRQSAEKELGEYSDELSRSNKELEDFAYVASHDLQEPLRKIQAFGNLLMSEYAESLGEEGADYLNRMHSAASRMSTLIEDLLVFSRVTRKQPELRDIDLTTTVANVVSDLETSIANADAIMDIGTLPVVRADPTHMRQLFQNLIGNAIKFHKPGQAPRVSVSSRVRAKGHEITVADNGIGFDEKYLDRIFSVFQRLHERSSYEGTGIGLAVCRKIVERYGGTITAASSKGSGSTFIVWLPHMSAKEGKNN